MYCDVVIVGGGIGGVLAAGWLRVYKPELKVCLIEPGELGSSYSQGGLRYLRHNLDMEALLGRLGVPYGIDDVVGGVIVPMDTALELQPYPGTLMSEELAEVQRRHYFKTRGTLTGFSKDVMNFGGRDPQRFRVSLPALIEACAASAKLYATPAVKMDGGYVKLTDGFRVEGKTVISTIPLPVYVKLTGVRVPGGYPHRQLNVMDAIHISEGSMALRNYDYVYTPWLQVIHRARPVADGMEVEFNSAQGEAPDVEAAIADLRSLGLDCPSLEVRSMPGHLLPLYSAVETFGNHLLIGRFASWSPRMTADQVPAAMMNAFREE